jgi:uncharacterized protein YdiU (UPF0061 family)
MKHHTGTVARVLERYFGRVPMRFETTKKNNGLIFIVKQILENFYAHDIDLHRFFIDFKKSFDSINEKKAFAIISEFWDTQEDRTNFENYTTRSPSESNIGWGNRHGKAMVCLQQCSTLFFTKP